VHPFKIISRLVMLCLTALTCTWLSKLTGAWIATACWAAILAVLCGGTALLMRAQAPGRVTPINYLAGIVLPWGYKIGRGKLPPIVLCSWLGWLTIGTAAIILTAQGCRPYGAGWSAHPATTEYHRGSVVNALLFLSWVIDGAVLVRLVTVISTRSNPIPPGTLKPIAIITLLLLASIALAIFGHGAAQSNLALLLTAGPIVIIGGGYGLMILVMVTFGRNTRWN
jgi:hypothetical protein